MPRVELIWDVDCPNVKQTRAHLLRAFASTKLDVRWQEWRLDDPDCPKHALSYGSPTLLVDGRDVAGQEPEDGACCRLYKGSDGTSTGVIPEELMISALQGASQPARESDGGNGEDGWKSTAAVLPALGVALLPKVACPACWPAYAGILSSLGLSVLMDTAWLLEEGALGVLEKYEA